MSKKLLSTLIASLFAAAPALAQSDDPMRVEGSATLGGIYNNQSVQDATKLEEYQDLGNGVMSNIGLRGRNSTTWFTGYGENFGRTDQFMFLRGGMYDIFKAGAYLNDMPHNFLMGSGRTPYNGSGGNVLTATFPNLNANTWNAVTLGLRPPGCGRILRVAEEQPLVFPGGRQPGDVRRHQGRLRGERHQPRQRLRRPRHPDAVQDEQLGRGSRLPDRQGDLRPALGLQPVRQLEQDARLDQPVLRPEPARHDVPAAGQHVQQVHVHRQLPRPAVALGDFGAVHVGGDQERHQPCPARAQHRPRLQRDAASARTASTARTRTSRSRCRGRRCRRRTSTPASITTGRKLANGSDVVEYGNAPTQPLASGLGCGNYTVNGIPTQTVGNCESENYNYTKNNVGFDVWWRFLRGQRLGFGYDYNNLDQTRVDYDKSHSNRLWVEYKNTMLDTISGRLKYEYLKRDSTLNCSNEGLTANNPNYLLPYTSAFDLQSQHDQPVQAEPRLQPDAAAGALVRGQMGQAGLRRRHLRARKYRPPGLLPERQLGQRQQADAERLRQLGGNEVPVRPPLHRHGLGRPDAAAWLLHGGESELLQPEPPLRIPAPTTGIRRPRIRRTWSAWAWIGRSRRR